MVWTFFQLKIRQSFQESLRELNQKSNSRDKLHVLLLGEWVQKWLRKGLSLLKLKDKSKN